MSLGKLYYEQPHYILYWVILVKKHPSLLSWLNKLQSIRPDPNDPVYQAAQFCSKYLTNKHF
jgi:hypothetical protein